MILRWELVLVHFHVLTVCFSTFPISLMVVKCHSGGMGSIVWILSTFLHQITFSLNESHISLCQILEMMAGINIDVYGSGCCRRCCSHNILAWCRWLYTTVTCLTTSETQCAASLHNTNTQRDAVFTTTRPQTPQINSTPICMLILVGRKLWFHSWINDLLPIWSVKFLLYTQGVVFYFSPSAHWLPLIPWVIPSVSQQASYAWKEGRTKRWREQRRKGSLKEKRIFFQTLCYWNEKEMFLMWENPLTSVQAVRWHRQLKSLTLCLFGYLSVTS